MDHHFLRYHYLFTSSRCLAAHLVLFVTVLVVLALSLSLQYAANGLLNKETWAISLVGVLAGLLLLSLFMIHRLPQSPQQLTFKVPLVPLLPAMSILVNVYLMVNMRMITWIQYGIYMAIGKFTKVTFPVFISEFKLFSFFECFVRIICLHRLRLEKQ